MSQLGQDDVDRKQRRVVIINQDSFYKTLNEEEKKKALKGEFNFDHPGNISNKQNTEVGIYFLPCKANIQNTEVGIYFLPCKAKIQVQKKCKHKDKRKQNNTNSHKNPE